MTRRGRVLVVAYLFPPLGGAGVQRPLKWVKYLPEHGWDPVVLTTSSGWYPVKDPTLGADVPPGTPVVRAHDPGVLRFPAKLLEGAGVPVLPDLLRFPDGWAAWLPAAVAAGLRAIRRHRPDAILTTSSPYSAHVVGMLLKRRTGLPWIADFRDEWTDNADMGPVPRPTRRFAVALEERIVAEADRVTVTSDAARLTGAPPGSPKRLTITNGVDEEDAPPPAPVQRGERMVFAHVGTLYGERDARPVLAALARLAERSDIDPARVEFRTVGNIWVPEPLDAGPVALVQTGYVDHATAVAEMTRAHVLVLHIPSVSRAVPGKLFEYLTAGRPILAVLDPGNPAFAMLRDLGAGRAHEADDAEGIEASILALYRAWEADRLHEGVARREDVLERYGRRPLTRRLARLLDEVSGLQRDGEVVRAQEGQPGHEPGDQARAGRHEGELEVQRDRPDDGPREQRAQLGG